MVRRATAYEALSLAIRQNWPEAAEKILKRVGTSIVDENWSDYILLIKALQRGCRRIVKLLLKNGCRVNTTVKTNFFYTPLYYAVRLKDPVLVRLLLAKGALINGRDFNQETSLYLALKKKYYDIVNILLSEYFMQAVDINFNNDDYLALGAACFKDDLSMVTKFIKQGIDINRLLNLESENEPNCTPLHIAVKEFSFQLVELLLKHGADINIKNALEQTPVHSAFYLKERFPRSKNLSTIMDLFFSSFQKVEGNSIDNNRVSYFHIACTRDKLETVEQFLTNGVDINDPISSMSTSYSGYTPLHLAIECENLNIVELLLNHGAQTTIPNAAGNTSLHLAFMIFQSDHSFINSILNYVPKNINSVNKFGLTHFHIACAVNNVTAMREFIESGVSVNIQVNSQSRKCRNYTPLHFAVTFNSKDAVELLLQNNADVNIKAVAGFTPLHLACQQDAIKIYELIRKSIHNTEDGYCMCSEEKDFVNAFKRRSEAILNFMNKQNDQIEIVDLLLKYKSFIDSQDDVGKTPLFYAYDVDHETLGCKFGLKMSHHKLLRELYKRRYTIIETLLKYNLNVNICDNNGNTILHHIANLNKQFVDEVEAEIVDLLIHNGANLNLKNQNGETALHIALKEASIYLIETFLKYDFDVNIAEYQNLSTPLHLATCNNFLSSKANYIISTLLEKGADVDAQMIDGRTALHIAASTRYSSSNLKTLLKTDCDINIKDQNGRTPLHMSCVNRNADNVQLLLDNGADINITDNLGNTPFYYFYEFQIIALESVNHYYNVNDIYFIFQNHINRLKLIDFYVSSDKVLRFYTHLNHVLLRFQNFFIIHHSPRRSSDQLVIKACIKELENLKKIKISSYGTLYDLLFKDPNEMALYAENKTFNAILQSETFENDFEKYGYLIKLQFKRGVLRSKLLEPAEDALEALLGMGLPDACLERIFRYLNNKNLKNLIKAKALIV